MSVEFVIVALASDHLFHYKLPTNTVSKIKNQRLSSKKYYLTLRLKYYIKFELC